MILEIPVAEGGSITGSVMDAWQCALEDVGPVGVDKGRGGKYLILPPGYREKAPEGYIVLPSDTFRGYAVLRSNLGSGSDEDIAKAVAYGKRVKLYPLSKASGPPPTKFVDAVDVVYDNIIPYDVRYFESLNRFVQAEPWLERDKAMIDMLKSIGIQRGRPFAPDAGLRAILQEASRRPMHRSTCSTRRFSIRHSTPELTGPCQRRRKSPRGCRRSSPGPTVIPSMSVGSRTRWLISVRNIWGPASST